MLAPRLGMAFTVGLLAAAGAAAFSPPADAQGRAVNYVGSLGGGFRGCPLNAQDIRVNINGTKVTGYWIDPGSTGRLSFSGEMTGASFRLIRKAKTTGNETQLSGTIDGDRLEVHMAAPTCNYRAVLKKQDPVRYVGTWEATFNEEGCGMTGRTMEIEILGSDVSGYREVVAGTRRVSLRGKLQGSSFTIERHPKNGNHETIPGEVKGDLVEVSFQGARCSYRATLRREAPTSG